MRIWLEPNDDPPKKKLKYGWRLVEHDGGHFTGGVDTSVPNRALRLALEAGEVPELVAPSVRAEVKYGENSRIDFLLTGGDGPDCYVEVKSVTLCRTSGLAEFPDSVTARGGAKHMGELAEMARRGATAPWCSFWSSAPIAPAWILPVISTRPMRRPLTPPAPPGSR